MNRGLKLALYPFLASLKVVTNLDPMNRGLKPVGKDCPGAKRFGYKPRPDE